MNPFSVVKPFDITDAMLISTDVPETDYAEWSSGTTYALGDRRIIAATHTVWESLAGSNLNHPPAASPTWWIEVSKTNRWKLFDTSNSTQTAQATTMTYTLRLGASVTLAAALNLVGVTSMRVRVNDPVYGVVYDVTTDIAPLPVSSSWWEWFFGVRQAKSNVILRDLPAFPNADLSIDFTGSASLAVGVLLFGQVADWGLGINYGASVGIQDYSRKETNTFGDAVLVQRAFAKRAQFNVTILKAETDYLQQYLAELRATPCLWIGADAYESTYIFGFYKDFDILIAYPEQSDCSITLEGLT